MIVTGGIRANEAEINNRGLMYMTSSNGGFYKNIIHRYASRR